MYIVNPVSIYEIICLFLELQRFRQIIHHILHSKTQASRLNIKGCKSHRYTTDSARNLSQPKVSELRDACDRDESIAVLDARRFGDVERCRLK